MKRMHYPCPSCGKAIKISVSDMARGYSERLEYMICPYCREEIPFPIRTEPALDFPMWAPDKIKEPTAVNALDAVIARWCSAAVILAGLGMALYAFNGLMSGKPFADMLYFFAGAFVLGLIAYFDWVKTFNNMKKEYEERKKLYEKSIERLNIEEYTNALKDLDIPIPAEYFSDNRNNDNSKR